jgi:putative endonuclease
VEAQVAGSGIAEETGVDARQTFGRKGEDLACRELTRRGYIIVDRRFRTRCGELDIVATDGDVVVFVEVKARSGCKFGSPFESLTWQKRRRLSAMAEAYLFLKRLSGVACRFDVVSILESTSGCTVELIRGAFDLESCHR